MIETDNYRGFARQKEMTVIIASAYHFLRLQENKYTALFFLYAFICKHQQQKWKEIAIFSLLIVTSIRIVIDRKQVNTFLMKCVHRRKKKHATMCCWCVNVMTWLWNWSGIVSIQLNANFNDDTWNFISFSSPLFVRNFAQFSK